MSTEKNPSAKQVYKIAHLAVEALGHEWPEHRQAASDLITELEVEPVVRALGESDEAWLETH